MTPNDTHLDTIRERFTATADTFAEGVRTERKGQAERLAECATAGLANASQALAVDVACGPGTYTRPLAARVRRAIGVDLTPAMVEKARAEAELAGVTNIEFLCADVNALPFENGTVDVISCGYAVHHMAEPARSIAEMVRVLRPGGRVAIMDCIVAGGADAAALDAIERVRDPSHTNTQTLEQFRALFHGAGLRVVFEELKDRWHDFDGWMRNAGSAPGDPRYAEVRHMLENATPSRNSGLGPRRTSAGLEVLHPYLLIVGGKPE
jgi:ubiquinone/menaquinone biosynthesis C-methylase UbiE